MVERCFLPKHLEKLFHFGLYRVSVTFFTPLKEFLLKKICWWGVPFPVKRTELLFWADIFIYLNEA